MKIILIALATLAHLVPHPFSVSSIGATALYAGAYGKPTIAWAVPLLPLLIGNAIFGFYDLTILAFVYAGFALSTLAGRWLLRSRRNYLRYGAAVTIGATIFYLVSNFAVWLAGMYPPTLAGLAACYVNGLPYLGQAAVADGAFCFVLFGLHALIERRQLKAAIA